MLNNSCTTPGGSYVIPDPSWCPNSSQCIMWNVSLEDAADLCWSRSVYLERYLGSRRSPFFLPMCVFYLLIFCTGAVGNALTCAVIARHHSMRTPTNFYLVSLAVSDLLVLILGLPLELYELWSNYPFLLGAGGCYFKTCLFETVCFASVLNVTAVSAERYLAIVHPLRAKHVMTRAHARRVIVTIWVVSFLCALPNTSMHGVAVLPPRFGQSFPESTVCMLVKPAWIYGLLVQVTAVIFFLIPMTSIGLLYLLIALELHKEMQKLPKKGMCWNGQNWRLPVKTSGQRARHRQVTKMLFVLVVVFGICWAPFHMDRVMWSYIDEWSQENDRAYEVVHLISGIFFYLSSTVNPILYSLMSTRFRELFREVACQRNERKLSITQTTLRSMI